MPKSSLITILHTATVDEPFFVIKKRAGLPSCPLNAHDKKVTALGELLKAHPQVALVHGEKSFEAGLLHRLDGRTSGLLLCAATQEFFDALKTEQENGGFIKSYEALCSPKPDALQRLFTRSKKVTVTVGGIATPLTQKNIGNFLGQALESLTPICAQVVTRFRPFGPKGKAVRPVAIGEVCHKNCTKKLYETFFTIESAKTALAIKKNEATLAIENSKASLVTKKAKTATAKSAKAPFVTVRAKLSKGFRHQVRSHLSFLGLPIVGDALYNEEVSEGEAMQFFATGLEFFWEGKKFCFCIESGDF